jgi:hypothetical protein
VKKGIVIFLFNGLLPCHFGCVPPRRAIIAPIIIQ